MLDLNCSVNIIRIYGIDVICTRKKDVAWSFRLWKAGVKSAIKSAKECVGYDPTHQGGFNIIGVDARGKYRSCHPYINSPNFIGAKMIWRSLFRWSWTYKDIFKKG